MQGKNTHPSNIPYLTKGINMNTKEKSFREKCISNLWNMSYECHGRHLNESIAQYEKRCKSKYDGKKLKIALSISKLIKDFIPLIINDKKQLIGDYEDLLKENKKFNNEDDRMNGRLIRWLENQRKRKNQK